MSEKAKAAVDELYRAAADAEDDDSDELSALLSDASSYRSAEAGDDSDSESPALRSSEKSDDDSLYGSAVQTDDSGS